MDLPMHNLSDDLNNSSENKPVLLNNRYLLSEQSESIQRFAERFIKNSSFYNAFEELIVLRYALSEKISLLTTVADSLKSASQIVLEQGGDPKEAMQYMKQAAVVSNDIIFTVERAVKTLKTGAEIDALSQTRLDGVQLLFILEAIPKVMSDILRSSITSFLRNSIENKRISIVEEDIDSFVESTVEKTIEGLRESKVLTKLENSSEGTNSQSGITMEQMQAMINTVPIEEQKNE